MWRGNNNVSNSRLGEIRSDLRDCGLKRGVICSYLTRTPLLRERKSGIVGPEPDWSVRFSELPNDEFGRRRGFPTYGLLRELIQPLSKRTSVYRKTGVEYPMSTMTYAQHACLETVFLTDEGVLAWTRFAHKMGITFNGERKYNFPTGKKVPAEYRAWCLARACHKVSSGKRSPEAALRRGEARRQRLKDPIHRARRSSPIVVREPLVVRPALTAQALRRSWRAFCPDQRWSEYRSQVVNPPVLTLAVRPSSRQQLPLPVLDAVEKIYRTSVPYTVAIKPPKEPKRFSPVAYRVRYQCRTGVRSYEEVLAELQEIEESGFPASRRGAWFNLNRRLEDLRVAHDIGLNNSYKTVFGSH